MQARTVCSEGLSVAEHSILGDCGEVALPCATGGIPLRTYPSPSRRGALRRLAASAPISKSVYEEVTDRILDCLRKGVVPWRKPWKDSRPPANAVSKHAYRGINLFLLSLAPYRDHRWVTYLQAQELGGTVCQGQAASRVVFWKRWQVPSEDQEPDEPLKSIPLLRFYYVFNVEQCEGLRLPPLEQPLLTDHERIERAERMAAGMPDPPRIVESGYRAAYRPSEDVVQMPPLRFFRTADSYYGTLFHELGHATGHATRLNRPGIVDDIRFGSDQYSREELIAELTSAFCCAALGLDNSLKDNSASYIDGWLKSLKGDPKAVVVAATYAQKAADYIQGASSAVPAAG